MEKRIAIITTRVTDFRAFVIDIYENLEGNKSRLGGSNCIEIEHGGIKTIYHQVRDVNDLRGMEFDDYKALGDADLTLIVSADMRLKKNKPV